jgi:hypothetical protein
MICINSIRLVKIDHNTVFIQITGNYKLGQEVRSFINETIGNIWEFKSSNPMINIPKPIGCNLIVIILTNLTYLKSPQLNDINGFIDIHLESIPK